MKSKAYKILTKNMQSFCVKKRSKKYCIKYSYHNIIKSYPGSLGIFCFDNIDKAIDFNKYFNNKGRLFIIIGYNPIKIYKLEPVLSTLSLDSFYKNYQEDRREMMISNYYTYPPEGTICFKSIRIIKEVRKREGDTR